METPTAICPRCKSDVHFVDEAGTRRCPLCGFKFPLYKPAAALADPPSQSPATRFVFAVLKALAIIAAIGLVVIGVLFAGCLWMFKNNRF